MLLEKILFSKNRAKGQAHEVSVEERACLGRAQQEQTQGGRKAQGTRDWMGPGFLHSRGQGGRKAQGTWDWMGPGFLNSKVSHP